MKASAGSPASSKPPSFWRAWAELAGLWALAIAWPVYQRVASGPEALTGLGIRRLDLVIFIAVLSLGVPLVLSLPGRLAGLFSMRAARVIHATMVGLLAGLIVWAALGPGFLGYLLGGLAVALALVLRLRTGFGRNFAGILSIATPVTIVLFLGSYPVSAAFLPGEEGAPAGQTDSETPVVLVVLDEFPLAALMNDRGHVDRRFFPTFSRLEREATWYRQAISLTDHTNAALPSILTGEDPRAEPAFGKPTPPGYPNYPDTVCSIPERAGYEIASSQFLTDLCGREGSLGERLSRLLLAGIPNHIPDSVNKLLGGIVKTEKMTPGRIFERAVEGIADAFGPHYETWGADRDTVFEEFTDRMPARPGTVNVIHAALPHAEYQYLKDGTVYASRGLFDTETTMGIARPDNARESAKNLQQLTDQAMYVDQLVGRMIDRLKREGVWDETLFALVADHGASFRPGGERRSVTAANSGWLLPVPLFIKFPGQKHGKISDVAADIRDVTPTILGAIGLDPSPRARGVDLREQVPPRTPEIQVVDSAGSQFDLSREQVEKRRRRAIAFRNRALGPGLYALGGHPDLIGQPVSKLGDLRELPYEPLAGTGFTPEGFELGGVPAYFQADLEVKQDPGPLAIVIDGRIVATARAWPFEDGWRTALNLPVDPEVEKIPEVSIYPINR